MPQLFQVLRCYKCLVFQIHQTKKSSKWQCKMCGEKQSLKRHYGLGNGKECRLHVQKLNGIRGEIEEEQILSKIDSDDDNVEDNAPVDLVEIKPKSKWSTYIEKEESVSVEESEPMYLGDKEVCLEIPSKRRKNSNINRKDMLSLPKETEDNMDKTPYKYEFSEDKRLVTHEIEKCVNANIKNKYDLANKIKGDTSLKEVHEPKVAQKMSKWAEFVEIEDDLEIKNESHQHRATSNNPVHSVQSLFEQCVDSELDKVLDI